MRSTTKLAYYPSNRIAEDDIGRYLYDPLGNVAQIQRRDGVRLTRRSKTQAAQEGLAAGLTERVLHFHCNHLGTPQALIDAQQGRIVWQAELYPWGKRLQEFNPEALDQPIRMQGQHHDRETGLFYNRYRYYQPNSGRYLTQDPVGLRGGLNAYLYPGNPINEIDPVGLTALSLSEIKDKISLNNNSGLSNNLILCQIWKETNFDPSKTAKTSTATGLMQMTKGAVTDVNNNFGKKFGVFTHEEMTDPDKAISAGTAYDKLRIKWAKGNTEKGLNGFGDGPEYSKNILECEKCLDACQGKSLTCKDEQGCLNAIHK